MVMKVKYTPYVPVREEDYEGFYHDIHYSDDEYYEDQYEPDPQQEAIYVYTNRYPREEDANCFDSMEQTGVDLYFAPNCPDYEARRVVGEFNSHICSESSPYMSFEQSEHGKFFTIYTPEGRDESGEIPEPEFESVLKFHATREWVDGYGDTYIRTFERNPIRVFHKGVYYSSPGTTLYYAPECTEDEAKKICSRLNSKIRDCADDIYSWKSAPFGVMFHITHPSTD